MRPGTAAGLLALPNVQASAPRSLRNQWAGYCSGTVKEYWTKWGTSTNLQKTGADWNDEVAQLEDADAAGKILLPIVYAPMSDTRDMTFARATFLLGWNGSSPSALIWDTPSVAPWSPAWTASIGSPVGARRQVTGGVWRRDFTGGVALVNPDPSATVSVPLGGTFTDGSGASVTSVTLGPASGSILFGTSAGAPTTTATTTTAPTTTAPAATTTTATTTTATTTTARRRRPRRRRLRPPPPATPKTLGPTTPGTSWTVGQPADTKYVNAVTLSGAGSLTSIRAYVSGAGGSFTEAVRGVVYDDANGAPGALRGSTATIWLFANAKPGWVDLAFSSPLLLPAGQYWLGLQFGGWTQLVRVSYTSGADGDGRYNADAWQDGASKAFGAGANDHERWSVYATVTTKAAKRTLLDKATTQARAKVATLKKRHRAAAAKKKHRAQAKKKLHAKHRNARTRR